jgi:hypothetical protein
MSLETRIAVIGLAGALAGTIVGGAITYKVTQEQISSQRTESRRAERLDAYAKYFGDATKLWTRVFAFAEVEPRPKSLDEAELTDLNTIEETLTGEFALVVLLAPRPIRRVAQALNNVNTDVWNALNLDRIDWDGYTLAKKQIIGANGLLKQFADAAKTDLGSND